jgi:hypothetical protein
VAKPPRRPRRSDRYGAACAGPEVIARACAGFIDMNHRLRCPLGAPPTEEALNHRAVGQTPVLAKRTRNVVDTSKCVAKVCRRADDRSFSGISATNAAATTALVFRPTRRWSLRRPRRYRPTCPCSFQ